MDTVLSDADADVIFINSFGGLTKMDLIAEEAVKHINDLKAKGGKIPPIVMRLRGTGEEEAREIVSFTALPSCRISASFMI
jgi:succinyl-CoA synthetase beta subunit